MSSPKPRLEQIQRWMQSVIMHRGGVQEGVGSPEARRHLDVELSKLDDVILRSQALSSAERLEIYVDAYYARLMECLEEEFAATRGAVGEELFAALAFGYLQSYPSQSYTLGRLGAHFPRYLAESRLHAAAAPVDAPASWPEFVCELAAFERLLYEVFDGEGTEGAATLDPADLARLPAEAWNDLRLLVAPSVRLCRFGHPVHESWRAAKDSADVAVPLAAPTHLVIHRRNYRVVHRVLSAEEFALLSAIVAGATLGDALATAVGGAPTGPLEAEIAESFARFAADGYLTGIQ